MTIATILLMLVAAIIAFMMAFFQYFYKSNTLKKELLIPAILRFLAIFLLLTLLIDPKIKIAQLQDIRPSLNVLVDNTSSIFETGQTKQILEFIASTKADKDLNEKFELNYYKFSDKLSLLDSLGFKGAETNLLNALSSVETISKGKISPTLLISDGNQTYGNTYEFYKPSQAVYPIIVGDTLKTDDLLIGQVNVNSYANLNNQFPVEVFLQYEGEIAVNKAFRVRHQNRIVFEKILNFSADKKTARLQFNLPANSVGMQRYSANIGTLENEKNTLNNRANFSIEIIDEQANILVLSKLNHPDLGMLKRAIEVNKQRKVTILSNFNQDLKLQDAQLIILYQPDATFKKVFEEIAKLNSNIFIITGTHTDWGFLNEAQPFFKKNSIGKLEQYGAEFNVNFTEFILEDINFSDFPPLEDMYGEINFSTSYKSLLYQNIAGFSTESPLLATISERERRLAVLFGEHIWKWRMQSRVEDGDYNKFDIFFNKLIQYLASTMRSRQLEVEYHPFGYSNSPMLIKAQYFDATYTFDNSAQLILDLVNNETKQALSLPFTLKNSYFEVELQNLLAGDYTFNVRTADRQLSKGGAFTMLDYAVEKQFTMANVKALRALAVESQGEVYFMDKAPDLLSLLKADKQYKTIQRSTEKVLSLIEWKWLLAGVLFFLSLEWFIRKYKGLI